MAASTTLYHPLTHSLQQQAQRRQPATPSFKDRPAPRLATEETPPDVPGLGVDVDTSSHLNRLLADYMVFYQKLRNFHWNVRGKRFFQLHEFFEEFYRAASDDIDTLAERISRLGETPLSTLASYLEHTRLREREGSLDAGEMVGDLVGDIEALVALMGDIHSEADEVQDVTTCAMLEDMIVAQEQRAWMLSCWLDDA